MSLASVLLPGPSSLRSTTPSASDTGISLELTATRIVVACLSCTLESSRIHSFYQRTVADLPGAGVPVTLQLHVRRCVCRNPAYRKRVDFKTILVDLSTNCPLELLPDARAATLARWLQDHPGVTVIAPDRAGSFAEGARQGAPNAIQVADRFHLMQNLRAAIEEILKQMVDVRQVAAEALAEQTPQSPSTATPKDDASVHPSLPLPDIRLARDPYRKRVQEQRRAQRLARYQHVRALHQGGETLNHGK